LLQGPAGALRHFKGLNYSIGVEDERCTMKVIKGNKEIAFIPPQRETLMCSDEEVFQTIGATTIFAEIIKAKVPLIFHNGLFDIAFLYSHFISSLPSNLDEFKSDIISIFPDIFDTKTIARNIDISALNRLNLQGIYRCCLHSNEFKLNLRYEVDENFQEFLQGERCHEAAYDSFITGIIFLHLREYIKQKFHSTSNWELMNAHKNLICLNRINKSYLNLNFKMENNERNEHVVKFRVNDHLEIQIIAEILSGYGDVFVRKVSANDYVAKFEKLYEPFTMQLVLHKLLESGRFIFN
jgi:hypothetical protein